MRTLALALALVWMLAAENAPAGEAVPAGGPAAVLDNDSYWRVHLMARTPVGLGAGGQLAPVLVGKEKKPLPDFQTPPPPAGWMAPEFDDSAWSLTRYVRFKDAFRPDHVVELMHNGVGDPPYFGLAANQCHLICARARFPVEDPGRVNDLKLTLEFVGGAAVYVNGKELVRVGLPAGELKPETLAERYTDDPYVDAKGNYGGDTRNPNFGKRYRSIKDKSIPQEMLRKGVNVIAIEVHRAPLSDSAFKSAGRGNLMADAALRSASLTAVPGSAVTPNARPKGYQVWACDSQYTLTTRDFGIPGEKAAVALTGARSGVFSQRVVVSSTEPIRGLRVKMSDLVQASGGGAIPAAAVRLRFAEPATAAKSWCPPGRFDGLLDNPPALVAPANTSGTGAVAMCPVWMTVRVPAEAKGGDYTGTLTIESEGNPKAEVPVRLKVHDWKLPDPKDFRQHPLDFHSAESVARHYGLPLWSDKHFEYLGKSLALMAEVNARRVWMDLAINWAGQNDESVVRWIKQPDSTYKHDFTVFDKYLDTVAKSVGKPLPLRLNCWGGWKRNDKDGKFFWSGPSTVSLLDPASGKVEPLAMPPLDSPEFMAFWKPVLDEARKKIEARGWFDVTCLGHNGYADNAAPQVVSMALKIWPDGVWGYTAHNGGLGGRWPAAEKGSSMPVTYSECVWSEGDLRVRGARELLKPRQGVWCGDARNQHQDHFSVATMAELPEEMILRGHDGVGQLGVDFFPIAKPNGGYFPLNNDRGGTGPNNSTKALLAPGPDGPVATERFEAFREGTQACEAVLFLERALAEKRVAGELAARVERLLDERSGGFVRSYSAAEGEMIEFVYGQREYGNATYRTGTVLAWEVGGSRRERDNQLFALCAEVAGKQANR